MLLLGRVVLGAALSAVCVAESAYAQERGGAGRLSIGGGVTFAGCHIPYGVVGQADVRVASHGYASVEVIGAIRSATFGPCPQSPLGPSDESRIATLASGALRVRVAVSQRMSFFAQAGEAAGAWTNLPSGDEQRPAVAIPFAEAGMAVRLGRRFSFEVAAMNLRNIYRGDDATSASVMLIWALPH